MRQFVLPEDWDGSPELTLGGRDAHRLVRVLRLGPGDRFPALDAAGLAYFCEIRSVETGTVLIAIDRAAAEDASERELPDLRGGKDSGHFAAKGRVGRLPRITLAMAMLKGEKFDLVIRQAAEAGVTRIIPLATTRSLGASAGEARRERQRRILREALQQSGSPLPTSVEEMADLRALPERLGLAQGRRVALLLHETPLVEASLHEYLCPRPDEVVVCVGPEGGFTPEEVNFLLAAGFLPLHLPGAVLRAETAALFSVAAVEIVVSEQDSWIRAQD